MLILFFALFNWLELLVQCWLEVITVDILVLLLILEEKRLVFYF